MNLLPAALERLFASLYERLEAYVDARLERMASEAPSRPPRDQGGSDGKVVSIDALRERRARSRARPVQPARTASRR